MIRIALSTACVGVLFAATTPVVAQNHYNFDVAQSASRFTFGGTVQALGLTLPIVGNPSNQFTISGGNDMILTSGTSLTNGRFVASSTAVVVPTLSAKVNNPISFLPPIATVTITGVLVQFSSPTFTVNGSGGFTAQTTATIVAGSGAVTGLATATIGLAGIQSSPQPVTGTLRHGASGFVGNVPINISFPFSEPSSGLTGTLTLNGTLVAEDRSMNVDGELLSASTGGSQAFTYSAGSGNAGNVFFVLGSITGTSPGIQLTPSLNLPVNFDGWTSSTINFANAGPFFQTVGVLDSMGVGNGSVTFPPFPFLSGFTFNHAFMAINGTTPVFVSNASTLRMQ